MHMQRFTIYTKSNKFYWSNNKIIYPILFTCLVVLLIANKGSVIEKNFLNNFILGIMLLTFTCGIILRLVGIPKTEPLQGELDGFLTFEMDSIQIHNEIFYSEKIRNIEISNDDYYDKLVGGSRGNFNSARSNGVGNYLRIKLYSGEFKTCYYELYNSDDFQKIRRELINYYLNGKIEFQNLANVLGEKSQREIEEFKIEVEKIANSPHL